MSWVLHRIDDRLIHGQVVVAWGGRLNPRRIWVADDASAANDWERELLASSAPGVDVRVVSVAEAAAAYQTETEATGGAFLLVRSLPAARALVEAGARVPAFNVGGLHYAPGKDKVAEYVYLDAGDRAAARTLLGLGIDLYVQDIPAAASEPLARLDRSLADAAGSARAPASLGRDPRSRDRTHFRNDSSGRLGGARCGSGGPGNAFRAAGHLDGARDSLE
jgi:mannose/fructose/N-acetylgalactosamine-specific phosphotransferase system component IIB